jgi:hypothetical protein
MPFEWKPYIAQDSFGDLWVILSVSPHHAAARVYDITHQRVHAQDAQDVRPLEDDPSYASAIRAARRHKNVPIFAGSA